MSFFPVDRDITTSSIWVQGTPAQLKVFMYLMFRADPNTGIVPDSDPAIANACVLPLDETLEILDWLGSPDEFSRTPDNDGRRIERTERGRVRLLNHHIYRNKDYSTPRVNRFRDKKRNRNGKALHETLKRDETHETPEETTNKNKNNEKKDPLARPRPVYWDNATQNIVLDEDWLRSKLADYQAEAKTFLTREEFEHEREQFRLELVKDPCLRACIQKQNGKPSSDSKFRAFETLTVGRFKNAIRFKADRIYRPRRQQRAPSDVAVAAEVGRARASPEPEIPVCGRDHTKPENRNEGREWAVCIRGPSACGWKERLKKSREAVKA